MHDFSTPLRARAAILLGILTLAIAAAPPATSDDLPIDSLLVIDRVGEGRRSPVFTDAVEAMIVGGSWKLPAEGDEIELPDDTKRTWRRLEAGEDGRFEDVALQGGYAVATVELEEERILLLDARGHRHVYVNGVPRAGDIYDFGITRVPVRLAAGANELIFKGGRGRLRARLVTPPGTVFFEPQDRTLPDAIVGEAGELDAAILVSNATNETVRGLVIAAGLEAATMTESRLPALQPLAFRKMPFRIDFSKAPDGEKLAVIVELRDAAGAVLDRTDVELRVRRSSEKHVRTFVSRIDGSVQYYAVTPPPSPSADRGQAALFLSLHGAGVEATNQAYAYAPRDWGYVVAPTNRRPYGFDWEDWGRLDALEVLEITESLFSTDPARLYLTGHSMGGHGTWNIGGHYASRFAAIAPSAGWRDFWSYTGASEFEDTDSIEQMLIRSANGSRTLLVEKNFTDCGVYVLHGDQDATVPVDEARFMRKRLGEFHSNFAYFERPGAGHWWGNECMDWPPLFEFLRRNVRPEDHEVRNLEFTTVNPGISATAHWVTIEAQTRSLEPSRIEARIQPTSRRIEARTVNVARFKIDLSAFAEPKTREQDGRTEDATVLAPGEPMTVEIDGRAIESVPWPADGATLRFERDAASAWVRAGALDPDGKGPDRAGPFKDAFRHRMIFVYGTKGSPEQNAWAFAKARYDAETFWYRGNGSVDVMADVEFDAASQPDRGVILYGNADTNSAWVGLLPDCPIDVRNGSVRVGEKALEGDRFTCLFIRPRVDSDVASVGVVAGTGITGMRLANQLPYFVSGVGYPDWIVLTPDLLERGARGVLGAGFFDRNWSLGSGDAAWR